MARYKKKSEEWWHAEYHYITHINAADPGKQFDNDPLVFARYCRMQAKFAFRDGQRRIGKAINQICKIATTHAHRGVA